MDITGIFITRTFNRDIQEKRVETPSSFTNPNSSNKYGDDWIYDDDFGMWRQKTPAERSKEKSEQLQVPFVTEDDKRMGNHIPNYNYLNEDDPEENWVRGHLERYEREEERRKQKKLVKITHPDEYIEDTTKYGLVNEHLPNDILTYDDEIALLYSYHKDEKYVDKSQNIITIVNRTDNYVEFTRNAHLGKLRNEVLKKTRVDFLTMMDFKPGETTDFYKKKD